MADSVAVSESLSPAEISRGRHAARILGWGTLFLVALTLFTLLKLPDQKINGYVQGEVARALQSQGMDFKADRGSFEIGLGVGYRFEGVSLTPRGAREPIRLESLEVSPALLQMLTGRMGGRMQAEVGGGSLSGSASLPAGGAGTMKGSFTLESVDLGKLGIVPMFAMGLQASGRADGDGTLSGDLADPRTLDGELRLKLSKITLPEQTLMGFKIPKLTVSEGTMDIAISQGRANIRSLKLGKPGTTDDLVATITGDATFKSRIDDPELALKARFQVSDKVKQAFTLLDMVLGSGKQPDGSYAFQINGPMHAPVASPGT